MFSGKNQKRIRLLLWMLAALFTCAACQFSARKGGENETTVTDAATATPIPTPTEVVKTDPSPTVLPTETPTPSPEPTALPTDVPTPTPKPEEYFVELGNTKTGKTVTVGSYQYTADIHGIRIGDLDEFKEQIRQLPNLLYVDMCNCGLSNEQMEDLVYTFPSVRFVWSIKMKSVKKAMKADEDEKKEGTDEDKKEAKDEKKDDKKKDDEDKLEWVVRTDALAFSTLHTAADAPALPAEQAQQLKYCVDLVALDFGHNYVYDLSFAKGKNIHILITVDTWDTKKRCMLDDLSEAAGFENLMYLETFMNGVSDLSPIQNCKELRDLNISYNPVKEITYIRKFPKLERLVLEHTSISKDDYDLLCEIYPDTKVVYYGTGSVDQGWREHPRYFAMIDMFKNNYWNDLFRTEDELKEVAGRNLLIVGGTRYYGTPYVLELNSVRDDDPSPYGEVGEDDFPFTATDQYGRTWTFRKQIAATVGSGNIPTENDSCNFDAVGSPYSTDTDGAILVRMDDGRYHLFYKNEVLARILIEKLDADGELKEEYLRENVEERVRIQRAELNDR